MLTEMKLVPHSHFGMPGSIQKHTLVYTVLLGLLLTVFFDMTRIAALGIILYLIMDIALHWGIFRHLREEIGANPAILLGAIFLDLLVLAGFIWIKISSDVLVVGVAGAIMVTILAAEALFLRYNQVEDDAVSQRH